MFTKSFLILLVCVLPFSFCGWGSDDKVKLKDVEVLTLYAGRMTNGRRSAPVPQLNCVGGTAGCNAFRPQVVQCYNRGFDGQDYQWECKTDMDNAYRFGQVSVTCEGYSYPDDPYILKGSCGLEYTIDLTKEGFAQQNSKQHNYYGTGQQNYYNNVPTPLAEKGQSFVGGLLFLIIIGFFIYALYRTCLVPTMQQMGQTSPTNDDYRPNDYPGGFFQASAPPPPGFNPSFTQGTAGGASCGSRPTSTGAGGFWTGAATGGILGYMFGRSNTDNTRSRQRDYSSNANWGGPSTSQTYHSSSTSDASSGTRTASGFGGTKRR